MTICAYCQQDRPATKEHIIPAFLYSFQKELEKSVIGWNEVAQRMVGGELKIKDVCSDCNNGVLSDLDTYGKRVLSDSGLLVKNYETRDISLEYDYGLLLRWLLKLSFNSSRSDGVHSPLFQRYIPFIRGFDSPPSRSEVCVLLYLARPEVLNQSRIADEKFTKLTNGSPLFNPFLVRICYGGIPGEQRYVLRMIVFGPAIFFLMMFEDDILPGHAAAAIRRLTKVIPGTVEINPRRKMVYVRAGEKSWLDFYEQQISRVHASNWNQTFE